MFLSLSISLTYIFGIIRFFFKNNKTEFVKNKKMHPINIECILKNFMPENRYPINIDTYLEILIHQSHRGNLFVKV